MLTGVSQRLIQFKRIAVLTDLLEESDKTVRYAASLSRWYGSELLLVHAGSPEFHLPLSPEPLPNWPGRRPALKEPLEKKLSWLKEQLTERQLAPRLVVREATIPSILADLEQYHPSLLVVSSHGREGISKWLLGSVAEEVFRKVPWPVLVIGPGVYGGEMALQQQFSRVLYATDLSAVSASALQYAACIAHDHEARFFALYVDSDPGEGFTRDRVIALQRLQDWVEDRIDGVAETLVGVHYLVDFGQPDVKIIKNALEKDADLVVVGARGLGAASSSASHFLGGTAYEVICRSPSPVLIVPQPK